MIKLTKRILISAGELSGDIHAAELVRAVTEVAPRVRFYGMGANSLQKAGVDLIVNANTLSIIGGLEIITKLVQIWRAFRIMKYAICHDRPDLLILVDYAGFNLRLAKIAKKAGVKVLYFISPKVWAWRQNRIKIIKKCVDMVAVIFPFEVAFYNRWDIPVKFVGNPLLKFVTTKLSTPDAQQLFNLNTNHKTIGLFPGSRRSEIKRLLPVMLQAAKILQDRNPNIQFILAQASSINNETLQPHLESSPIRVQVVTNKNYEVMQVCDAIIAASGTTTLEVALMAIPLIIIYKMAWFEYQIAKHLVNIPYVGLCNILANKQIALELLQDEATPDKISHEIEKIISDDPYRKRMIDNLRNIKKKLVSNQHENISALVLQMIK